MTVRTLESPARGILRWAARDSVKPVVRSAALRNLRDRHRSSTLSRAVREISRLAPGKAPSWRTLARLRYGWGQEDSSASLPYLAETAKMIAGADGPILQCGSGLTTVLLELMCPKKGIRFWNLEDLAREDSNGLKMYDTPPIDFPDEFSMIVCDGQPGSNIFGRYGLFPIIEKYLHAGTAIAIDDDSKEIEAKESCQFMWMVNEWKSKRNMGVQYFGEMLSNESYAVLTVN